MKKIFLLTGIVLMVVSNLAGQKIRGQIFRDDSTVINVVFPAVFLIRTSDSACVDATTADMEGMYQFHMEALPMDEYAFYIHGIGYAPYLSTPFIKPSKDRLMIKDIYLKKEEYHRATVTYSTDSIVSFELVANFCADKLLEELYQAYADSVEAREKRTEDPVSILCFPCECKMIVPPGGWVNWLNTIVSDLPFQTRYRILHSNGFTMFLDLLVLKRMSKFTVDRVFVDGLKKKDTLLLQSATEKFITGMQAAYYYTTTRNQDELRLDFKPVR